MIKCDLFEFASTVEVIICIMRSMNMHADCGRDMDGAHAPRMTVRKYSPKSTFFVSASL